MNSYITHTIDTKQELKKIYENKENFNVANQMEVWAIIGRSLTATSLVSQLTRQPAKFTIAHPNFYVIIDYDGQDFTYDFKLPQIKVKALPDWAINLSEYLIDAKFSLQIGNVKHITNYVRGTVGDEISILVKQHYKDFYNVVSLGVLLDKYSSNDIIESAGYIMLFKDNISKESLVYVINKIPMVTRLLLEYKTAEELQDYLITKIDEEILKGNIKYKQGETNV